MLRFGTREIAISAIMAALVCAPTLLIQLPIPATQGFFNVGDSMVMVAALTFGPIVGFFAGGFGSSLADLIGGWYVWVPFTLVIKGLEGFLAGSVNEKIVARANVTPYSFLHFNLMIVLI